MVTDRLDTNMVTGQVGYKHGYRTGWIQTWLYYNWHIHYNHVCVYQCDWQNNSYNYYLFIFINIIDVANIH